MACSMASKIRKHAMYFSFGGYAHSPLAVETKNKKSPFIFSLHYHHHLAHTRFFFFWGALLSDAIPGGGWQRCHVECIFDVLRVLVRIDVADTRKSVTPKMTAWRFKLACFCASVEFVVEDLMCNPGLCSHGQCHFVHQSHGGRNNTLGHQEARKLLRPPTRWCSCRVHKETSL